MCVLTFIWFLTMTPDNNIGVRGVKALIPSLKRLTQLTKLGLTGEYSDRCERVPAHHVCYARSEL